VLVAEVVVRGREGRVRYAWEQSMAGGDEDEARGE
jgi:hypothetical protein